MESFRQIPESKKSDSEVEDATSTVEAKIIDAKTFGELYEALRLVGVIHVPDGKDYNHNDVVVVIEKAREQLKTSNMKERETILTQEGFKNSPMYPLRNIPEAYGLRDKVNLLLRSEK